MGFPTQEYWSGFPFPSPGGLLLGLDPGIKPLPALQVGSFTEPPGTLYKWVSFSLSSVQFSRSVVSDSLWPYESQQARRPCPSPTPGVYTNSCPSSRWCHPAILSSVVPFSSYPESLPASGSFQMSQLFTAGGQSIGVSTSTSVLPMNTQDWSPLRWTGWISLQSKGLQHHSSKASFFWCSAFFTVQLSHDHWKNHSLD